MMNLKEIKIGASALLACCCLTINAQEKPNVVLIYGDDVGYGDVGANGSKMIPTPNIDRLAQNGLNFTDGHSSSQNCSPSRYALLTGEHPIRTGVKILGATRPLAIEPGTFTLPDLFKKAGYHTAIIGKWHLGLGDGKGEKTVDVDWNGEIKPGPLEVGFDYSFVIPVKNDNAPCVYMRNHRIVNLDPADPIFISKKLADVREKTGSTQYPCGVETPEAMTYYKGMPGHDSSVINGIGRMMYMAGGKAALWDDETISDTLVEEARNYIAAQKDKPFFLYFPSQAIHTPRTPHPRFHGKTKLTYRGDAMVELDWKVGEVMKTLKKHGLDQNTIVIFSSDNGPAYSNGYYDGTTAVIKKEPLDRGHDASGIYRGGKGNVNEGGTRVPFIVSWPGKIKPGISDALVGQIDLLASFADFLDIELPAGAAHDSRDLFDTFLGKSDQGADYMLQGTRGKSALRLGSWKYIAGTPGKLYDLSVDPGEDNDLAKTNPETLQLMQKKLEEIFSSGRMINVSTKKKKKK